MRRIAIVNQKGGCGKTTTAINLAGVFARAGRRTLLVDTDPQSHCAAGLAIPENRIDLHIGDAMLAADSHPVDPARLLWRVSRNLDLAPSSVRLATLESTRGGLSGKPQPEQCLAKALAQFNDDYDLCLIDCSPAIGLLTFNALCAADQILIPVETGFFSLQGASRQVNTIKSLAKRVGGAGAGTNYRLLPTMHDPESALARDLLEELRRRFPGRVAPMVIRFDQRLRESASFGQPVVEYAPDSTGAADYRALADWLLTLVEEPARDSAATSVVNVVPGIGDRVPPPVASTAASALEAATIAAAAAVSGAGRAADIAARARRLQDAAAEARATGAPEREAPQPQPAEAAARNDLPASPDRPLVYGARASAGRVTFLQPATLGKCVCVAGEFNNWSADATPMALNEAIGAFELHLPASPGILQYRLVVDGRWMTDPYNPLMAPGATGTANSVVVVPGAPSTRTMISATG